MNDRIRELAVESGFATGYDRTQTGKWSLSDRELEKFAELIVQECKDIAYEYDGAKLSGPGMIIANRIEQHFGVAE